LICWIPRNSIGPSRIRKFIANSNTRIGAYPAISGR